MKIQVQKTKCKLLPHIIEPVLSVQDASEKAGWQITAFDLPRAWKKTNGDGVKIAVIDTGCDLDHPDLINNLLPGYNVINPSKPPRDDASHGSHVSGILVAENNDIGMIGVAPKAKVIPIKTLDKNGSGSLENVAIGVRKAIELGADIICMSLGSPNPIQQVRKAIQLAYNKGIPVFCAAGNAGNTKDVFYPAAYPETIAIGSIDEDFNRSGFSNTGKNLDFMAPGGKILSTVPNDWYGVMSGTCIAKGSYVYGPNGPKKIENISIGDVVYAFKDGKIVQRTVVGNYYRGKAETVRLIASGRDVNATLSHKVLTLDIKSKELDWVSIAELNKNHKLLLSRSLDTNTNPYLDSILTEDFCWLLGFLMGDGWISETNRSLRVHFALGDKEHVMTAVKNIYEKHVGKQLKDNKNGGWCYDDSTRIAFIIECLGFKEYAQGKDIPLWLWNLSKDKQMRFYEGYLAADGHSYETKECNAFECVSPSLIRRMAIFADYMGWKHSAISNRIRHSKAPNSKCAVWRETFSVQTYKNENLGGWHQLRLRSKNISGEEIANQMGINTDQIFCSSWKIQEIGKELEINDVYDLSVPDADCFVTQGLITHNSMAAPWAAGLAALLLSYARKNPDKIKLTTVEDYKTVFKQNTIPINNKEFGGKLFFQGFGIIDPRKFSQWAKKQ